MKRVIIVEREALLREGLRSLFIDSKDFQIIAEAESLKKAMSLLLTTPAEIVLMHLSVYQSDWHVLSLEMMTEYPQLKLVVLSSSSHTSHFRRIMEEGAKGFILTSSSKHDLFYALKQVSAGENYVSPELVSSVVKNASPKFTSREIEVLELMLKGFTSKEIAEKLFLSRRTIESHRNNLMAKTNSKNASMLINYIISNNILQSAN